MTRCELCGEQSDVRVLMVEFRPSDRIAFASAMPVCDQCIQLLASGQTRRLGERLTSDFDDFDGLDRWQVAKLLRERIQSVGPAYPRAFGVEELREAGFEPLEEHTGLVEELAPLWPEHHRTSVPETRPDPRTDDGLVWLVRSPWPQMTVADVIWILWPWVEREPSRPSDFGPRVAEVFAWSEREALNRLAADPPSRG